MAKICSIEGCGRPSKTRGWCNRHYLKWWSYGDPLAGKTLGERGAGHQHTLGYRAIGNRLEHRIVAERMLGRPLKPGEVVHHIDGDRSNNDPNNLQVFASQAEHASHHAGVRRVSKEIP